MFRPVTCSSLPHSDLCCAVVPFYNRYGVLIPFYHRPSDVTALRILAVISLAQLN